ncbi:MAG: hypothetical protein K2H23_03170 [Oscillospiraceae bacterium]|nr:hypothetical protein [Oscillospiraceae bacterium]
MKKAAIVLMVIGAIFFVVGIFAIYTGFASQNSEENSIVFEKNITAQIVDVRMINPYLKKNLNSKSGYTYVNESRCEVEFIIKDGENTRTEVKFVPKSLYDEYSAFEKNKDMEFKLYRNEDGADFLSLKDIEGATADYQEIYVSKNIAVRMIAGLITAAIGWALFMNGDKMRKKAA